MVDDRNARLIIAAMKRQEGRIAIRYADGTEIQLPQADRQLNYDIAIAVQGFFRRTGEIEPKNKPR